MDSKETEPHVAPQDDNLEIDDRVKGKKEYSFQDSRGSVHNIWANTTAEAIGQLREIEEGYRIS